MKQNFKTFLESQEEFDLEQFKKDTAFFFAQRGSSPFFLYHGSKKGLTSDFKITTQIDRTRPKDSMQALHNSVNELFVKKFGYPFRNGMFATGNIRQALEFGQIFCIFPIGHFEWLASDDLWMRDMTLHFNKTFDRYFNSKGYSQNDINNDDIRREAVKVALDKVVDDFEKMEWLYNEKLNRALNNQTEIMLKMDKFYIVNRDGKAMEQIDKWLKED